MSEFWSIYTVVEFLLKWLGPSEEHCSKKVWEPLAQRHWNSTSHDRKLNDPEQRSSLSSWISVLVLVWQLIKKKISRMITLSPMETVNFISKLIERTPNTLIWTVFRLFLMSFTSELEPQIPTACIGSGYDRLQSKKECFSLVTISVASLNDVLHSFDAWSELPQLKKKKLKLMAVVYVWGRGGDDPGRTYSAGCEYLFHKCHRQRASSPWQSLNLTEASWLALQNKCSASIYPFSAKEWIHSH